MSRPLRISYQNAFYHITSRGHRKEKIFYDDKDKRTFIRKLDETFQKYTITCYAYCLMDNYYHLFLKTTKPNISQALHYLNTSYANWFCIRYQLAGSVFQGRFKSILVDADNYALVLSVYIHLNPLCAGIVDNLEDYPYSSYLDYVNLRKSSIDNLNTSLVLNFFSPDYNSSIRQYREYILDNQNPEDPLKQTYRNIALGNDDFIQKIKAKIKNQKSSREIPVTNLTSSYNPKEIIQKVCAVNQIEKKRLMSKVRGNIYRSLSLYLIKKLTPLKLTEIGELFTMDYSAVSQAVKRFEQKCKKDKEAERIKDKVIEALKNS
jgi:putative transposase